MVKDWKKICEEHYHEIWRVVVTTTFIPSISGRAGMRICTRIYLNLKKLNEIHDLAQELGLPASVYTLSDRDMMCLEYCEADEDLKLMQI